MLKNDSNLAEFFMIYTLYNKIKIVWTLVLLRYMSEKRFYRVMRNRFLKEPELVQGVVERYPLNSELILY